jgi:hypothetical protein
MSIFTIRSHSDLAAGLFDFFYCRNNVINRYLLPSALPERRGYWSWRKASVYIAWRFYHALIISS